MMLNSEAAMSSDLEVILEGYQCRWVKKNGGLEAISRLEHFNAVPHVGQATLRLAAIRRSRFKS